MAKKKKVNRLESLIAELMIDVAAAMEAALTEAYEAGYDDAIANDMANMEDK